MLNPSHQTDACSWHFAMPRCPTCSVCSISVCTDFGITSLLPFSISSFSIVNLLANYRKSRKALSIGNLTGHCQCSTFSLATYFIFPGAPWFPAVLSLSLAGLTWPCLHTGWTHSPAVCPLWPPQLFWTGHQQWLCFYLQNGRWSMITSSISFSVFEYEEVACPSSSTPAMAQEGCSRFQRGK